MEIERNNELFLNAPRPLLATAVMDAQMKQQEADGMALRTLIHIDDPEHKDQHLVTEVCRHAEESAECAHVCAESPHLGVNDVAAFDAADPGPATL